MADQVEEIKQKTDIVSIISAYVDLNKSGTSFKALCPFHSEKTPSFYVSPELQIFKCFGCQKSGDVITFLEEYEGMEFYEALKYLAEKAGIELKPLEGRKMGIKERLYEINYYVLRFYQYCLLKHPAGKEALLYFTKERGLTRETVEKFKLGFSPNEPLALEKFIVDRKKITIKELGQAGVIYDRGSKAFDRFRGRVIFPLFDFRGNVAGFAGRLLPTDTRTQVGKYINTPETPVYHKSKILYGLETTKGEIKKQKEAIIVEGELDLISCWQVGIKNVVAIKGSALTEEQVKLLSRYCKRVILALDEDVAGNEAARRGISIAEREGFDIKVVRLGKYKDPDDAARKNPEDLKKLIKGAIGIWDFIIDSVFEKYKNEGDAAKSKISRELIPVLSSISDRIVQAHYVNLVARKLEVPVEAVSGEMQRSGGRVETKTPKIEESLTRKEKTRTEILEERLLAVSFKLSPKHLENKEVVALLTTPFAQKIAKEYASFSKKRVFDPSEFAEVLPKELVGGFTDLVLKEVEGLETADESRLEKEIELILRQLEILRIKKELEKSAESIRDLELAKMKNKLKNAENEFSRLTRKLSKLEDKNFKGIIL